MWGIGGRYHSVGFHVMPKSLISRTAGPDAFGLCGKGIPVHAGGEDFSMPVRPVRPRFAEFFEREYLRPDLNRAVRSTAAFMVPMVAIQFGWVRLDPVLVCIGAHSISLIDVRGLYRFRLGLLLAVSAVLVASVSLGAMGSGNLAMALGGSILVTLAGGLWRHLSVDYGPGLAVSSGLLYFISLAGNMHIEHLWATYPAWSVLAGALWGTLLQVMLWPIHPQHPLRTAVAESWLAMGDWMDALASGTTATDRELELRAVLNKSQATLHASTAHAGNLKKHLEALNLAAARLGLRIRAFRTALLGFEQDPGFGQFQEGLAPLRQSLSNIFRSVALAVVSRQPAMLATFEVRLKRLQTLLGVARSRVIGQFGKNAAAEHLIEWIHQIEEQLPGVHAALRATMERADERAAFSLELRDLDPLNLKSYAASLDFTLRRPETALIRHTVRATVLGLLGVAVFKLSGFPHGYWLPFTILVVLQPDFGSTREKAVQRVIGTLAGGLIASSLLWLHLPLALVLFAVAVTIFLFGYYLKRSYGVAVVFITLMVVLMTESHHPVTLAFTLERMGSTLVGGVLALGAAWIFWPTWERSRFPPIFAKSLCANRAFLDQIVEYLRDGRSEDEPLVKARQAAESANADAFSSLRRMIGDPKNQQEGLQQSAALANGNQRIIDALVVVALHLNQQRSLYPELLEKFAGLSGVAFETLTALETFVTPEVPPEPVMRALGEFRLPELSIEHRDPDHFREPWVLPQLFRILTELNAMLLLVSAQSIGNRPTKQFAWQTGMETGTSPAIADERTH